MVRPSCFGHIARSVLLLSVTTLSASGAEPRHGLHRKDKTVDDKRGPITLTLSCDREYVAGFPFIVEVELRNVATNLIESLRRFGLFDAPGKVAFVLRGEGHEWTWPPESPELDGEPTGMGFGPGTAWLALQDLSDLHPDVPPGHYRLSASAVFSGAVAESTSVAFDVRAPSEGDRATAARLRASNDLKKPSWRTFVRQNWSTPDLSGLSASARTDVAHHLAYYLYLHKVAYGPTPIAALDPDEPWRFAEGVLNGEAALARLEILSAAHSGHAGGVEKAILERWPGLAWRVEEIRRGQGLLTELRDFWGVEKSGVHPTGPRPYQPR